MKEKKYILSASLEKDGRRYDGGRIECSNISAKLFLIDGKYMRIYITVVKSG